MQEQYHGLCIFFLFNSIDYRSAIPRMVIVLSDIEQVSENGLWNPVDLRKRRQQQNSVLLRRKAGCY
jgi:hypothetical protein